MQERAIRRLVKGQKAIDGAGVHLVRVLGPGDVYDFDPFLMLDSFDSHNPQDYIKGFPHHPHRGIETVTYLAKGEIEHQDSLGNKGTIHAGESQWMTAGSGIIHQEMPQPAEHMLGLQLWINLPAEHKMTEPRYFDITDKLIGEKDVEGGHVRVLSGEYQGVRGAEPAFVQATLLDASLEAGARLTIPTRAEETVFVFLLEGDALIGGSNVPAKTAVLFGEGGQITVAAPPGSPLRFVFFSGKPLNEEIAWGGPIVMNTREELRQAFDELDSGTFIRHKPAAGG